MILVLSESGENHSLIEEESWKKRKASPDSILKSDGKQATVTDSNGSGGERQPRSELQPAQKLFLMKSISIYLCSKPMTMENVSDPLSISISENN